MKPSSQKKQQRTRFNVLFLTELWERFGFYTVGTLLVLFMTNALGYSDKQAFSTYAAFSALLYITPSFGGYLADCYLGYCRTLLLGAVLLTAAYVVLALPFSGSELVALGLGVVGQGFFKSMPYTLLSAVYEGPENKKELDAKFTLYYLSIQFGGIAPLAFAGVVADHFGWHAAFAMAAVGMAVGVCTFLYGKRYLTEVDNQHGRKPLGVSTKLLLLNGTLLAVCLGVFLVKFTTVTNFFVWGAVAAMLVYVGFECRKYSSEERRKVVVALYLMALGVMFFALYYQQPTSLTLFVERNVNRHLLGFMLPASAFWVFSPLWIIVLGPCLGYVYNRLGKHGKDLSVVMKFGVGNTLMGVGYFVVVFATQYFATNNHVSGWWVVLSYFFQSTAELLVSALGFSMVAHLSPKPMRSVMMGMWLVSSALGGALSGTMADMTAMPKSHMDAAYSLHVYAHAFSCFGVVSVLLGLATCATAPLVMRYLRNEPVD